MYYTFESIALNEIGSGSYACSLHDIVPRGELYNEKSFQACAVSGSVAGQLNLSGRLYLMVEYGFKDFHLWRNVAINAAFFVFFSIVVTYDFFP